MAKLATQSIVIQISKAVSDSEKDEINVLDVDTVDQLLDVISELISDDSLIVEVVLISDDKLVVEVAA